MQQNHLYCLPVSWLWNSCIPESRRRTGQQFLVSGVLVLWWIVQTNAWPDSGSLSAISAVHWRVVFSAKLVSRTVSVVGARFGQQLGLSDADDSVTTLVAEPEAS
jgi:hypothetical protein